MNVSAQPRYPTTLIGANSLEPAAHGHAGGADTGAHALGSPGGHRSVSALCGQPQYGRLASVPPQRAGQVRIASQCMPRVILKGNSWLSSLSFPQKQFETSVPYIGMLRGAEPKALESIEEVVKQKEHCSSSR